MSVCQEPIISCYILGFIVGLFLLPCVDGAVRFTQVPPPILFVHNGENAKFVWNYHVNDRDSEFFTTSPEWLYTNSINQTRIAAEAWTYVHATGKMEWIWTVTPSCPARLRHRLSKESVATLVISNVSTLDNGNYNCSLILTGGQVQIKSTTQLIVTVRPTFLPSHPNNTYQIIEGKDLKINCTAIGPPTPTITWVNISDGSVHPKSHGSGSAVLQIDNIKRYHAGVYECRANNNPNETAATKRTKVTVNYKPTISKELSSSDNTSWNGRQITLKCTVGDGLPTPGITWYKPSGQKITTGVTAIGKGSHVVITTTDGADYGWYKCKATNVAGSVEHLINVIQLFPPGVPNATILEQDIKASSVTVRWTKPGYDGGSPVIDYNVQINSTKQEQSTSNSEYEFTGLTKNTRYEVRVYARNVVGYGNASIINFTTQKRGPPPLPSLHLVKNKTAITLSWMKPDENGGEIIDYTIYQKQGVVKPWARIHSVVRELSNLTFVIQVKDLEPGQTYWFIVTATNEYGESEIGDDKGKAAFISPNPVTTATQASTTGLDGQSLKKSDEQEKCGVTALAVCASFLAVSLVVIVLLLLYIWRNMKRKEPTRNTNTERVNRNKAVEDPVYDNTLEMVVNKTSHSSVLHSPPQSPPPSEYEPIRIYRDDHSNEMTSRVSGYSSTSTETPRHYQALSHSDTAGGSSHQGQGPAYESLHSSQLQQRDAQLAKNVPETTYQPLDVRQNTTHYQGLQTYNNMHQLENNRNNQTIR